MNAAKLGLGLAAISLAASASAVLSAPTIRDAGFENPALGSMGYAYSHDASQNPVPVFADDKPTGDWTFTGSSGVASDRSAFDVGAAPGPRQVGFLQSIGGTISQTISGFTPGQGYAVTFDLAGRPGYAGVNPIEVLIGSTPIQDFTPTRTTDVGYQTVTTRGFLSYGPAITLTFKGLGPAYVDKTSFVDNVRLQSVSNAAPLIVTAAVPEPSSWAAFTFTGLGVLGLIGAARRRRGPGFGPG